MSCSIPRCKPSITTCHKNTPEHQSTVFSKTDTFKNSLASIPKSSHLTKLSFVIGCKAPLVSTWPRFHKRHKCSQTRFGGKRGRRAGQKQNPNPKTRLQRATRDGGWDKTQNPTRHRDLHNLYPACESAALRRDECGLFILLRLKVQLDRSYLGLRAQTANEMNEMSMNVSEQQ